MKEYMFTYDIEEIKYLSNNTISAVGRHINCGTLIGTKREIKKAILKIVNEIDKL